jgi:hypothetical protein
MRIEIGIRISALSDKHFSFQQKPPMLRKRKNCVMGRGEIDELRKKKNWVCV